MSFATHLVKRSIHAFVTFMAAVTFTFVMIRQIPGGPLGYLQAQLAQQGSSLDTSQLSKEYLAVDTTKPLAFQYIDYLQSVLQGDMGTSIWYNEPALGVVLEALPWTVFYATIAMFFIFAIAIVLGAYTAYREQSRFDSVVSILSIVFNSTPSYVVGLLGIYILGYQYELFPTSGRLSRDVDIGWSLTFVLDALHHAALLIFSIVFTFVGLRLLLMRGNSISVLGEDYLRVARLRGLPESRIALRYVARNAILPMYTHMILSISFIFSGSTILETIFTYRGIGFFVFKAIEARDYPLMMASFLVMTLAVIIGVFIADMTYHFLDPRLRGDTNGAA